MKLKTLAAAAALVCTAGLASAADTDWSAHDPVEFGMGSAVGALTSILDTFSFSLGSESMLTTTAVSNESNMLDLTGAAVFLYSGMVGSGSFVSGFAFDSTSITSSIYPLAAGDYYYQVMASVGADAVAGSYTFTSLAEPLAPIPEPETYALMLGGLAAVGFLSARRRRGS